MDRISQKEYELLAAFRYSIRQFLHFSEHAAREVGLSPHQHQALLAIQGAPADESTTVGALANWLVVKPHTVSELVRRLESKGLILKRRGDRDARQVLVELTTEGRSLLVALTAAHRDELRRLGPALTRLLDELTSDSSP